ncbi:MAG TPA: BON domain-containing protein [Acidobacteriaceae bacterium]|nr:BON domain-containing protein [Acidobacteriaceae bacterium]
MIYQKVFSPTRSTLLALSLALAFTGCKSKPDDNALNTQVQAHLFADQNLSGQSIQTTVANGVVTLTGTVNTDAARSAAASDAAQIAGVKTVVNNLALQPGGPTPADSSLPQPAPIAAAPYQPQPRASKPSASVSRPTEPAPVVRNYPQPQPQPQPQQQAQLQPPPPPEPVVRSVTLPAGSTIPVRITQALDSATTQTGDRFTGAIASDIVVDGLVVLPQGTPVTGNVDEAKDAAHFKGSSLLALSLTSINRHGDRIQVATDTFTKEGEGRGKNTAEKVGGGAAVGAILGGIFGGGKGAAIGAAAGGGVGAGANGVTRGQQVQIPSETVVRFRLANSILLHVSSRDSDRQSNQGLERRNER